MKLRIDRSAAVLTAAIVLAYASVADAQDTRGTTAQRSQTASAQTGKAGAMQAPGAVRASELIGMDVRDAKGERIGDVNDLIVDLTSGRVMYAVVGIGGFLGIGEKVSALPIQQVKLMQGESATSRAGAAGGTASGAASRAADGIGRAVDNDGVKGDRGPIGSDHTRAEAQQQGRAGVLDNDGVRGDKGGVGSDRSAATERSTDRAGLGQARGATDANARLPGRSGANAMHLVVEGDANRLKRSPNFDKGNWPNLNDAKWRGNAEGQPRGGHLVRASQLMDIDLRDRQNGNVGEVEDLVVDMRTGNVVVAVVDFDQAWTPDDKLVAVPMKAIQAGQGNNRDQLVFAGDKSMLQRAPSFEKNKWPDLNSGTWRSEAERFSTSWRPAAATAATTPGSGMTNAPADRTRGSTAARETGPSGSPTGAGAPSGAGTGAGTGTR